MKEIKLVGESGNGKVALVDDEDYEKLKKFNWYLNTQGYAIGRLDDKKKMVRMHRVIVNCPPDLVVDHLNGDKLNNCKKNLRICSAKENANNRHDIKGYTFDKKCGKYKVRYKNKFFGRYNSKKEAEKAYKLAKSGVEYKVKRRKYYMLPKNISKQFGKYVVSIQKNKIRYRKVGLESLEQAIDYKTKLNERIKNEQA